MPSSLQRLVIDQFPGLFLDVGHTKLPPGALVDSGWSKNEPGRTLGIQITDAGELQSPIGHTYIGILKNQPNSLFAWTPPQGGTFFLTGHNFGVDHLHATGIPHDPDVTRDFDKRVNCFAETNPIWCDNYLTPEGVQIAPTAHAKREGQFVPYKDRLYYCDGVGYPLRIEYGIDLIARPMGISAFNVFGGSETGYVHPSRYRAETDLVISGSTYYAMLDTAYGHSPPILLPLVPSTPVQLSSGYAFHEIVINQWSGEVPGYVRGVDIYRVHPGSGIPFHIGYLPRGDSNFLDTIPDSLVGQAMPLEYGHPAAFRLMCVFENRMFGVGGFGDNNRVACSILGEPDVWPAAYELVIPDSGKNSDITAMEEINGSLYIFMSSGIFRLQGSSPMNYSFSVITSEIGCLARRTIVHWGGGVVFLSAQGVYFFDGSKLNPIAINLNTHLAGISPLPAAATVVGNQYYLSLQDSTSQMSTSSDASPSWDLYPGAYSSNKVYSINLVNGGVGCNVTGTFNDAARLPNGESLVLSESRFLNQDEWRERSFLFLYSKAPTYGLRSRLWFAGFPNYDTSVFNMYFLLAEQDMGFPEVNKCLDGIEIVYSALTEFKFEVRVVRREPRRTTGESTSGAMIVTEDTQTGTVPDSIISSFSSSDAWSTRRFSSFIPRTASCSFKNMTGKSFQLGFKVVTGGTEVRVHSVTLRYHMEDPTWKGSDRH